MSSTPSPAANAGTITLGGDLTVNRFGYGAMRLTGPGIWGPPDDHDAAKNVLRRAVEQGVNFIDTADSYGPNLNEELIAEALRPYPADLVIATKVGLLRTGPSEWHPFARPDYLRQQAETSRRRLGVDRIDLWQLHRIDPGTPEHDQFAALKALQEEGIVRHLGLSEIDAATLDRALEFGLDIATVQNRYNIVVRESEPVLERCEQLGIAFIPWFPIAQGLLAEPGNPFSDTATRHGVTTAQLSLAWLLHRSSAILPIPGTGSIEHLDENLAATSITLSNEEFDELDALGRSVAQEFDVPAGA
ncbi:aldo/keto reductase [Haloactinomyces albus]|uniref:Aryl-alcohol dehydrogenase-like predicted oxidoreductase n=1 Tax=Haloactinomyces albus TaxID=1352928 RepID=A0AAE4CNA2_9ACTN|nr:aldo/keto reductase [Haloactinomyces albus]MDR7304255.1 aryl-alcohol dehydrogenase-like predicted oxidoreductase [Haloactinomyces albus]